MWARKYKKCKICGTTKEKHLGRGLCARCYNIDTEKKHKHEFRHRGLAHKYLTKSYIIEQYIKKKKSLSEIAKLCSCSRQYVHKKMREYHIPRRSLRTARGLALQDGKIKVIRTNSFGISHTIQYDKIEFNNKFFTTWTDALAYVLGLLFTDGCLSKRVVRHKHNTKHTFHIKLAQKEPELLKKVLKLMNCNAKIFFVEKKVYGYTVAGARYEFGFDCTSIYTDLVKIGLKTKKSLDIQFPDIPKQYVRHFIRGCWDGDGTVYKCKGRNHISAGFFSGSLPFISNLLRVLVKSGLSARKIYIKKGKNMSYYLKYHGQECIPLFHYLYDGVPESQYLTRKYNVFKQYVDTHELAYSVKNQSQLFNK